MPKSYIERISTINPDLIAGFFATGRSESIPHDVCLFLQQLQWASEIYETEHNVRKAATVLRSRIAAEQKVKIEIRTCVARIYQAIDYFSVNSNVSIKVWENCYADRYEELASKAEKAEDYRTSMKCVEAALECRRRAADVTETASRMGFVFLISPEVTPELLGLEKKSMKKIAAKHNDGYYLNLFDSLPVDQEEKKRLKRDAGIEDAVIVESD